MKVQVKVLDARLGQIEWAPPRMRLQVQQV